MAFNPKITDQGLAAFWNAQGTGTQLELTHVGFGTGAFDPTGGETAPVAEAKRVAIGAGSRLTDTQIRIAAIWASDTEQLAISEINFYAGEVLFAVLSRATGGPFVYKTLGSNLIFSYDWTITQIPAEGLTISVDPDSMALLVHMADADAHPQYLTIAEYNQRDAKNSVRVATTANITLSGLQTIDGIALAAGDRVLVKNQATAKNNGIYIAATGAWVRASDADESLEVTPGMLVPVDQGTTNADSVWQLETDAPITLGTTSLAFGVASGPTGLAAGTFRSVTVDKRGRVIGGTNPTTLAGYGISDAEPTIDPGQATDYWAGDKTWKNLASAVRAAAMTGMSVASKAEVVETDPLLTAVGKLQAQVSDRLSLSGGNLSGGLASVLGSGAGGPRLVRAPAGGHYQGVQASTGAIKIVLPKSWSNTMMRIRLACFDYFPGGGHFTMELSGYTPSANSAWYHCGASVHGRHRLPAGTTVRFGHDGSKCCILIGSTSMTLAYLKVVIEDVMLTYQGVDDAWNSGWSISQVTDESGITISYTEPLSANSPAEMLRWQKFSGHHIFDASAGLAPNGSAVSDTNPLQDWTPGYPTLMGWNGTQTYGVRVARAQKAEQLLTERKINGVGFNGTQDITVADTTKLPLSGGVMGGSISFEADDYSVGWARGFRYTDGGTMKLGIGGYGPGGAATMAYMGMGSSPWSNGNAVRVTDSGIVLDGQASAVNGQFLVSRDAGVSPTYAGAQLQLNSGGANPVALGFHRPGSSACALVHKSDGLELHTTLWNSYANFTAKDIRAKGELFVEGNAWLFGKLTPASTSLRSAGAYGNYDSTKTAHIWSMGAQFSIPDDGSNFGSLYGLAYKHTANPAGGTMAGGHQLVVCANGVPGVALGMAGGIWTSGSVAAASLAIAGGIEAGGDIIVSKDNAWLTLDSPGTGGAGTEQAAGISIGEGGKKGAAALHLTYTGDGYGHIGMGVVDGVSGLAQYAAMKLFYQSNSVEFLGQIKMPNSTQLDGTTNGLQITNGANGTVHIGNRNTQYTHYASSTGKHYFYGDIVAQTNISLAGGGKFYGDGGGLVSLNASELDSGQVPSARLYGVDAGKVAFFARSTPPDGWLKANGAAVSRTSYAQLFAAIGTTFGAGNGSTTFNLPDLRGEFLRGWDDARGADPSRVFGSAQAAMSPDIPRDGWGTVGSAPQPSVAITAGRLVVGSGAVEIAESLESLRAAGGNNSPLSGDNRPRNVALLACIKF